MKFNLKSIVAAVAMTVASASAMAGIAGPSSAGGSELLFYEIDMTAKVSYVKDLGITFSQLMNSPVTFSANIAGDANYQSFLGASTAANRRWGVIGYESVNALAGGFSLLTTARNNTVPSLTSSPKQTNGNLAGTEGIYNNFAGALGDLSSTTVNSSYFAAASNTSASNWAQSFKTNVGGKLKFNTDLTVGTVGKIYELTTSDEDTTLVPNLTTVLDGSVGRNVSFDAATISVSAVPEPETYGMLLAGLALVGTIARRRRSV